MVFFLRAVRRGKAPEKVPQKQVGGVRSRRKDSSSIEQGRGEVTSLQERLSNGSPFSTNHEMWGSLLALPEPQGRGWSIAKDQAHSVAPVPLATVLPLPAPLAAPWPHLLCFTSTSFPPPLLTSAFSSTTTTTISAVI